MKAHIDRGRNLTRGILKAVELDQHFVGNAAFGPDRRKNVCHGFLSPFQLRWAVEPGWPCPSGPGQGVL
jgi:hypothetical protein